MFASSDIRAQCRPRRPPAAGPPALPQPPAAIRLSSILRLAVASQGPAIAPGEMIEMTLPAGRGNRRLLVNGTSWRCIR